MSIFITIQELEEATREARAACSYRPTPTYTLLSKTLTTVKFLTDEIQGIREAQRWWMRQGIMIAFWVGLFTGIAAALIAR